MNIAIPDRYLLAADFKQRATGFSFPAEVWNVAAELAEVSEPTSPYELEKRTGQSSDQVREALGRLLAEKLVRQNLLTWKEYTAARERARGAAKPAAGGIPHVATAKPAAEGIPHIAAAKVAPVAAPPPDKPVIPTAAPAAKPAQESVGIRLGTIAPRQTAASSTNAWVVQKPDPAQVAASKQVIPSSPPNGEQPNGRLLRPLLEQIGNIKGGGVEGQLLVYQVFLRVPYQLLHDEGIKALHFVDERTVIQNPALHTAIVKAAKEVAGIDLA